MKKKRFWTLSPAVILLCAALLLAVGSLFFYNRILFYSELAVAAVLLLYTIWHLRHMQKDIRRAMARVAGSLNQSDRDALAGFPLPAIVCSGAGEILWYNDYFRNQVLDGNDLHETVLNMMRAVWEKRNISTSSMQAAGIRSMSARFTSGKLFCMCCITWTIPS